MPKHIRIEYVKTSELSFGHGEAKGFLMPCMPRNQKNWDSGRAVLRGVVFFDGWLGLLQEDQSSCKEEAVDSDAKVVVGRVRPHLHVHQLNFLAFIPFFSREHVYR